MDASHPEGEATAGWLTVEEWSGSSASALSRTAVLTASASSLTAHRFGSRWERIGSRMLGAFVPEGFPGSVTPDYVPFQMWDTLQWFLRDLTGMLGGILFTFYQGSNLDSNAKMWRLVADFMNDLGYWGLIYCFYVLAGVASGATRAALTQHFALANNAADISAKEGSQETLATMLGMGLGMLLAQITRGHALSVWASFLSLTMFHIAEA
ncbi:Protein root UVB sensitive 3 [Zea mays]|uniref:Protein root UVB sensitive 3 n=1 Tax=Zea mays TaxID=4577 RepID=A0A3L6D8B9_MAIZE|nr:Protein root UVB sensitive 3 [Zea mays]